MNTPFWNPAISGNLRSSGRYTNSVTVIDVIVNEEHPDYDALGLNVGRIRFKYLDHGGYDDIPENGSYASPKSTAIQEYPLIGETVLVQHIRGENYYTRRVNINKTLQLNGFVDIQNRSKAATTQQNRTIQSQQARGNQLQQTDDGPPEENFTNENYKPRPRLHNLKSFDGDVILQNRYGATIRLGSSQMQDAFNQKCDIVVENGVEKCVLGPTNPERNEAILVMRVGETENSNTTQNTPFALTVENINLDSSCFVMAENQDINFYFSSNFFTLEKLDSVEYVPTINDNAVISGNQAILTSGRVVLNSKENDIVLTANRDSILSANINTVVDSGNNIYFNAEVGEIYLNTISANNSVVKFNELESVLNEILNHLEYLSLRPAIPNLPLAPDLSTRISITKQNIFDIKSTTVKIGN